MNFSQNKPKWHHQQNYKFHRKILLNKSLYISTHSKFLCSYGSQCFWSCKKRLTLWAEYCGLSLTWHISLYSYVNVLDDLKMILYVPTLLFTFELLVASLPTEHTLSNLSLPFCFSWCYLQTSEIYNNSVCKEIFLIRYFQKC